MIFPLIPDSVCNECPMHYIQMYIYTCVHNKSVGMFSVTLFRIRRKSSTSQIITKYRCVAFNKYTFTLEVQYGPIKAPVRLTKEPC